MIEYRKKDCITVNGAANRIGVKQSVMQDWVDEGRIETWNGMILKTTMESIKSVVDGHTSLETYLKSKDSERFKSKYARNREKYYEFLAENDFFGLNFIFAYEFPYPYEKGVSLYFKTKDINKLDKCSLDFFKYFGLSERDKSDLIINECPNDTTKRLLREYVKRIELYTPSVTAFIIEAARINLSQIKEKDVNEVISDLPYIASKDLMISFLEYGKNELSLDWGKIERKQNHTSKNIGAYPYRIYVLIAKTLFNEEELSKNRVLVKAFDKSKNFETWLFLSTHFVCGWRAGDICENWPYLDKETLCELNVNLETLRDDIIGGKISDETYFEIGAFIEKRIELAAVRAHKTKKGSDLLAPIGNELKIFFGRMALIAAYHRENSNEGKLQSRRISEYLNFVQFKYLFGDTIYNVIGRNHLSSKKLNKSYLQGIEARARKDGVGTMAAYTIASFARNHANIDTTSIYIYDHGLDGETAEIVLSLMLDRGVFGTIRYKEFLAAFPDAFEKLTAREQTRILAECEVSAYELEVIGSDMIAEQTLKESFADGNVKDTLEILGEMFEVAQGFGKAKDTGVYCKKRAVGEACASPSFESCIANVCPYLIFSEAGIKSLINVINQYKEKAIATGNPKYESILKKVIIPAYKEILAEISKRMNSAEKEALKKAIGEYNGKYVKTN